MTVFELHFFKMFVCISGNSLLKTENIMLMQKRKEEKYIHGSAAVDVSFPVAHCSPMSARNLAVCNVSHRKHTAMFSWNDRLVASLKCCPATEKHPLCVDIRNVIHKNAVVL